ncbi:MAG: hypothetical protein JO117_08300 [Verrucomicrobia bacterium]|nr:hypothetical protein [Verrucomicrobiota bacterium]MBV9659003.1 hypothetical protein [Verrucomicrobiota bacterium]
MIADIRRLLVTRPFEPFAVRTSDGLEYTVPTPDHAAIDPRGARVIIWFDDSTHVTISGLHLSAISEVTKP